MRITVMPTMGLSYDPASGETASVGGMRVEWQEKLGGRREHATILMESSAPQDMLRAAAAYFEAQDAS
jgi:hypothetical protein